MADGAVTSADNEGCRGGLRCASRRVSCWASRCKAHTGLRRQLASSGLVVGWWREEQSCGTAGMVRRVGMLSCKCEWVRGAKLAKHSSHALQRGVLVVGWEREGGSHAHWGGRFKCVGVLEWTGTRTHQHLPRAFGGHLGHDLQVLN